MQLTNTLLIASTIISSYFSLVICGEEETQPSSPDPCIPTEACHECSYWEKHSKHAVGKDDTTLGEVCSKTGYVEAVKCTSGALKSLTFRSCPPIESIELAKFWRFEGIMMLTSVVSVVVVMFRMRKLDEEHAERIQRQLSAL